MARPLLVARAQLHCAHHGRVSARSSVPWLRIEGSPVLVRDDLEGVPVEGCPNTVPPNTVCCSATIRVEDQSESQWVFAAGRPVGLSSVVGSVVCQPALAWRFGVTSPGQSFVREEP
jgi:hypothetical protein